MSLWAFIVLTGVVPLVTAAVVFHQLQTKYNPPPKLPRKDKRHG